MAEVSIDGEKVVFDGEPPATLGALSVLLTQVLAQNGRIVASMQVDGTPADVVAGETPLEAIGRIEVESLSHAEAATQVREATVASLRALQGRAGGLVVRVLRMPWQEVAGECVALAGEVGAVLENVGALEPSGHLAEAAAAAVEAVGSWVEVLHAGDAARIALITEGTLLPMLRGLEEALEGEMGA